MTSRTIKEYRARILSQVLTGHKRALERLIKKAELLEAQGSPKAADLWAEIARQREQIRVMETFIK